MKNKGEGLSTYFCRQGKRKTNKPHPEDDPHGKSLILKTFNGTIERSCIILIDTGRKAFIEMTSPIAVAMSGGIDSTCAALLLRLNGYSVIGIHFITGFEPFFKNTATGYPPSGPEKTERLRELVKKKFEPLIRELDIPFHIIDMASAFRSHVVQYFVNTYFSGRTPNPCLVCNTAVKFGVLLDHAQKMGAERLATGHYARITKDPEGRFHLLKGLDEKKDQSYFLSRLNQYQLSSTLFPLGEMKKTEAVRILETHRIFPLSKEESQDVCFIDSSGYSFFLKEFSSSLTRAGKIVDQNGSVLGEHSGVHQFTIGQRRGINCPGKHPYYVVRIDAKENRIVVGEKKDLFSDSCMVEDINWIVKPITQRTDIMVKIRYRHTSVPATLSPIDEKSAHLDFKSPEEAVTPGQGAVFYADNEIIGGGFIA